MNQQVRTGPFPVEPWQLREDTFHLERIAQAESIFALSNGHIGLRGNLDEGEPAAIPGTYLGSYYESRPLPYAETGYGYPEVGQTLVDVTNGKIIRMLVGDTPFDMRYGTVNTHERILDFRAGTLHRSVNWTSPTGKTVAVDSTRIVSLTQRSIAAFNYRVTAIDQPLRLVLQSELVANEAPPVTVSNDPRVAAALHKPLIAVGREPLDTGAMLIHRTRRSKLMMAAAMRHIVQASNGHSIKLDTRPDWARTTIIANLAPGQSVTLTKFLGYGWSATRSEPAVRDQVMAALDSATDLGWQQLLAQQREFLDEFWDVADIAIDGDDQVQQAVRFAMFHTIQAGARAQRRSIPAKGLTGPGYDGHAFWDTEAFVLPLLTLTKPSASADALRWRASLLESAKKRAEMLTLSGAAFPWRTINGDESGAYWPAGTAAFHINADITRAFDDYRRITGDEALIRECGLEVFVETARLWMSLGHHDRQGRWHIDGVTGPDEYTAIIDDNIFTNLMAARNLEIAADECERHTDLAEKFGVTTAEIANWRHACHSVYLPYDEELGVHQQCENFTRFAEWDFDSWADRYPLLLHAPYFELYRKQVIKQADVMLAMQWCPDAFTPEEKARNVDYYEARTVRDSSLSASTQAVMCAEVGHHNLAYQYVREASLMDLWDLHNNTRDGLHIASLAGSWLAVVEGFGGLRTHGDVLSFWPCLPDKLRGLSFGVQWRGVRLRITVTHDEVRCELPHQEQRELPIQLYGEDVTVTCDEPVIRPLQRTESLLPTPTQPTGRSPLATTLVITSDEPQPDEAQIRDMGSALGPAMTPGLSPSLTAK